VAAVKAKTTRGKGKGAASTSKAKARKGLSEGEEETTAGGEDKQPPPAYDTWTLEELQKEVQKYGYKPSTSKTVIIVQLTRVWEALRQAEAEKDKKKGKGKSSKTAKKTTASASKSGGGAVKATSKATTKKTANVAARRRSASVSGASSVSVSDVAEEDDGVAALSDDEAVALRTRLRAAIATDDALYLRILRYEVCKTTPVPTYLPLVSLPVRTLSATMSLSSSQSCLTSLSLWPKQTG
jgi:hypothetical protein